MSDFQTKNRQKAERMIVERVIDDALAAGYRLTVNDGEDDVLVNTVDRAAVLAAMFSTDEDFLVVLRHTSGTPDRFRAGWVRFTYGNDGHDVISDYIDNAAMNELLKGANALADKLEEEGL